MILVAGLGNPGAKYVGTLHNVGMACAERLATRGQARFQVRGSVRTADVAIDQKNVTVAVPLTYMNESGRALAPIVKMNPVALPDGLIVVHDELDLEPGVVRLKRGGGLAGHNGLRSIAQALETQDFLRVRIGVGKPPGGKERGAAHVLGRPRPEVRELLDEAIDRAADAVERVVAEGADAAMAVVNRAS